MPEMTLQETVNRLKENEERFSQFLNELGEYQTIDQVPVETIRSFLARKEIELNGLMPDSSTIGYTALGPSSISRSVASRLRESVSIVDKGGAGDGSVSDQNAVDSALVTGLKSIFVNDNNKFLVTALNNALGVEFEGYGSIVKAITGGLQKLNSYGDKNQYVFGQEYMAAFHNLLITQHTTPTRKPIMVFSGDSTTAGDGASADYQIDDLLKLAGEVAGLQTPFGLSSINRGQSGQMTQQWVDTHLAGDLAANPDLLVLRWGVNDPGYLKDGSTPPLNAGQSFPNRRDATDFATSLRAGLTTIRASRGVSSLSILLMTPNSTADTPNGRDELWYEQITPIIKQAARDFQCTFIDTYAYLRDSRPAAGVWMDNPFGDGRGIHPLNVMNTWIAGLMSSVVFPVGLRQKIGRNNIKNIGGNEDVGDSTRVPSFYPYGLTIGRANGSSAFPFDGAIVTIRTSDEIVFQFNFPFQNSARRQRFAFRLGRSAILSGLPADFGPFQIVGAIADAITPAGGFTVPGTGGARTVLDNSSVTIEGYIAKTVAGIIAANTTVGTVPAGYRPVQDSYYSLATVWDGTNFEQVRTRVNTTGEIVLIQATTLSVQRIWPVGSWTTYV